MMFRSFHFRLRHWKIRGGCLNSCFTAAARRSLIFSIANDKQPLVQSLSVWANLIRNDHTHGRVVSETKSSDPQTARFFFSKMPCAMRHLDTFAPFVACSNLSSHWNQWKFWTSIVPPCQDTAGYRFATSTSWPFLQDYATNAPLRLKARACLSKSENVQLVVDAHDDILTCIVDLEGPCNGQQKVRRPV